MKPITFPEQNKTFTKPDSMTDDECAPLPVCDTGQALVSCWHLTWRERFQVLLRGRVWLRVIGRGQPPVALGTERPFPEPAS